MPEIKFTKISDITSIVRVNSNLFELHRNQQYLPFLYPNQILSFNIGYYVEIPPNIHMRVALSREMVERGIMIVDNDSVFKSVSGSKPLELMFYNTTGGIVKTDGISKIATIIFEQYANDINLVFDQKTQAPISPMNDLLRSQQI